MNNFLPFPDHKTSDIRRIADEVRETFCAGELPVDVTSVIEFELGIEIRPVKDLKSVYGMDALLMSSMDVICVDEYEFMNEEMANRLRFSMAHELGHWYLHRLYYESFGVSDLKDAYSFIKNLSDPEYDQLEWQASEFAGRFLVKPETLVKKAQEYFNEYNDQLRPLNLDVNVILDQIVGRLALLFIVSESVLSRRILREDTASSIEWPKKSG